MAPKEFSGKLAIITGAAKSTGIGLATALVLAQQGADVCYLVFWNLTELTMFRSSCTTIAMQKPPSRALRNYGNLVSKQLLYKAMLGVPTLVNDLSRVLWRRFLVEVSIS